MKKLMLIIAVLMIAGGVSAHGYGGYHGGYAGYHGAYGYHGGYGYVGRSYGYCAPRVVVNPAQAYYGYGYRPEVVYRGGYYGGYYRGGRYR
jgi:hypothetical protein